jgi:hypothetical protein
MLKTITVTLLLFATPAMAQYDANREALRALERLQDQQQQQQRDMQQQHMQQQMLNQMQQPRIPVCSQQCVGFGPNACRTVCY